MMRLVPRVAMHLGATAAVWLLIVSIASRTVVTTARSPIAVLIIRLYSERSGHSFP